MGTRGKKEIERVLGERNKLSGDEEGEENRGDDGGGRNKLSGGEQKNKSFSLIDCWRHRHSLVAGNNTRSYNTRIFLKKLLMVSDGG